MKTKQQLMSEAKRWAKSSHPHAEWFMNICLFMYADKVAE